MIIFNISAHFIGHSNIMAKLKHIHNYSIAPITNDEIVEVNYIRPLKSFKAFRNLWEREPKSPLETGFIVWQEEYPKEIFTPNKSNFFDLKLSICILLSFVLLKFTLLQ